MEDEISLRLKALHAANELEQLASKVKNPDEAEVHRLSAWVIRFLASHIHPEKPKLRIVK